LHSEEIKLCYILVISRVRKLFNDATKADQKESVFKLYQLEMVIIWTNKPVQWR